MEAKKRKIRKMETRIRSRNSEMEKQRTITRRK